MSRDNITVSIITVTYNSESTLDDTMMSVINQTHKPLEHIIIDGQSTDNTLSIVEKRRQDYENAGISLVVLSEKDEGIYDAMNKGTKLAKGTIVGIINSDDWYEDIAVETVVDTYRNSEFDLFFADLRMIQPGGGSFIKHSRNRSYATSRDWNHPTTFITKEIYNRYSYKNNTIHDDYDLILRIRKDGARTVVVNKVLANFRMNGVSHKRSIKRAFERVGIKYRIYRDNGYSPLYFFECFIVEMGKLVIG